MFRTAGRRKPEVQISPAAALFGGGGDAPASEMFEGSQDDFGTLLKIIFQDPKSMFLHRRSKESLQFRFRPRLLFGGGGDASASEMFGNAPQDNFGAPPQNDFGAPSQNDISTPQVDVSAAGRGKPEVQLSPAAALFGGGGDAPPNEMFGSAPRIILVHLLKMILVPFSK